MIYNRKKVRLNIIKGENIMKYYKNYSIPQKQFLAANGVKPLSEGIHPRTKKTFQVYELDSNLSRLLTAFTEAKKKALGESHES